VAGQVSAQGLGRAEHTGQASTTWFGREELPQAVSRWWVRVHTARDPAQRKQGKVRVSGGTEQVEHWMVGVDLSENSDHCVVGKQAACGAQVHHPGPDE